MQHSWYKPRRYLHFDRPITRSRAHAIVTNSSSVAKHAFKPFLSYEISTEKIYKEAGEIKTKKKTRPISFAAHVDSHIYSYYCGVLAVPYEKRLTDEGLGASVLAFRKLGKNNIDFAADAIAVIRQMGTCTAIGYDISGFFDNLDHALLKQSWSALLHSPTLPPDHYAIFKSLTRFARVDRKAVFQALGISFNNPSLGRRRICTPAEFRSKVRAGGLIHTNAKSFGIPQGSPISAFLSNLYMLDFDRTMHRVVDEIGGTYYRYCDDMLFIIPTEWKSHLTSLVTDEISKLKLTINPAKTEVRDFELLKGTLHAKKPLQYLGFLFDGRRILLRSAGLARYSERMKRGVRLAKKTRLKRNQLRIRNGNPPTALYKRKLYETYSHLGKRNYIRYGLRAAEKLSADSIRRQLKPLWQRLRNVIERK